MITRKTPVWTLDLALDLIRELQPLVRQVKYHVLLGGGVLNRGSSEKDLDLFFIPLNGNDSSPQEVMRILYSICGGFGSTLRDSPDYDASAMWHYAEMLKYEYLGKRIDVFIQ